VIIEMGVPFGSSCPGKGRKYLDIISVFHKMDIAGRNNWAQDEVKTIDIVKMRGK